MLSSKTFTSKWDGKEGRVFDCFHEAAGWREAIIYQRMWQINSFFATVLSGCGGCTSSLISCARAMQVPAMLL